jgi:hypothetical protein
MNSLNNNNIKKSYKNKSKFKRIWKLKDKKN